MLKMWSPASDQKTRLAASDLGGEHEAKPISSMRNKIGLRLAGGARCVKGASANSFEPRRIGFWEKMMSYPIRDLSWHRAGRSD
jgi:hypothetical protein